MKYGARVLWDFYAGVLYICQECDPCLDNLLGGCAVTVSGAHSSAAQYIRGRANFFEMLLRNTKWSKVSAIPACSDEGAFENIQIQGSERRRNTHLR